MSSELTTVTNGDFFAVSVVWIASAIFPCTISSSFGQRRYVWLHASSGCHLYVRPPVCLHQCLSIKQQGQFSSKVSFGKWLPRDGAEEMAEHIGHIRLLCLVTLQGEDGDTHFLPLMCLLYTLCQVSTCNFLTVIFHLEQAVGMNKPEHCTVFCISPFFYLSVVAVVFNVANFYHV